MRNRWSSMLLLGWVLCASTAMAEPDTFGLGTGRDGVLTVTEPGKVVNRYAQVTRSLAPGDSVVAVSAAEEFAAGDLVMVLQTAGILPELRQGSASLITLRGDSVGQWELARIGAVDGQSLKLTAPLLHSFSAAGAQVIRVPEYTDVRVLSGASLVAAPWDGKAGGVLAFLASGTIHNGGALEASGAGFQGGRADLAPMSAAGCMALPVGGRPDAGRGEGISAVELAVVAPGLERPTNGGGGGLCPASGGGGGGNGAPGGRGGDALTYGDPAAELGGQGGVGLVYSMLDHLTLGGGGGQGYAVESYAQAGAGGGAIFIRGYRLIGGGTVSADGAAGDNSTYGGAGGGGSGGSVYLRIADLLEDNFVSVQGGAGGNAIPGGLAYAGPGGGGGGGRILYQAERAPAFAGSVEAGLAGDLHFASTVEASSIRAQPSASQASAYQGTITQLAGGYGKDPGCDASSGGEAPTLVSCPLGQGNTAPDTAITSNPVNPTSHRDATFTFTSTEANSTFNCNLDGTSYQNCASGIKFLNLADGSHGFQVAAKDASNNVDTTPASYGWVVDTRPLDTSITGQPASLTNNPNATFTFTATGAVTGFDCNLDGTSYPNCSSGVSFPNLPDGNHSFQVRAKDADGNNDPTPAGYTWVVDTTPPDTLITAQPPNPTNSRNATFSFTGTGGAIGFDCNLDGTSYPGCLSPVTYSNLADGIHTFVVRAKDAADNVDPSPATYTWEVDTVLPKPVINQKPSNPSNLTDVTFTFSGAGVGAKYWCKLDGAGEASCDDGTQSYSGLLEGVHTFCVAAEDAAHNKSTSDTCYTWVLDLTPPDTVIGEASKPHSPTNSTSATLTFTGAGPGGKYWCRLDSGAETSCDSGSQTYTGVQEGTHTFCVAAQDAAGNKDASPACYTWVVDLTPPDTVIGAASKPPNPTNSTNASFAFVGAGPEGKYWCKLDGGAETSCDSGGQAYTALQEGAHTFCVAAQDAAGNKDATPDCYTWLVDLTSPETVIDETSKPSNPTNSTGALFIFSGGGAGGQYRCRLDGSAWEVCNFGSRPYSALAEATHEFCVYAIDAAGNADTSPACYMWVVDLTPPDTVIDELSKPRNPTNTTSVTFTFTGAGAGGRYWCKLDSAPFVHCDSGRVTYTNLAEMVHTFAVYAEDAAGNKDEQTPATYSWQVDVTAPETTIDEASKPSNPANNGNATFTFKEAGPGGKYWCQIDQGIYQACNSGSQTYTNLPEGNHTFSVYAEDAAGNVDQSPATYFWAVDLSAPDTVIDPTSKPPSSTKDSSAQFRFSGGGVGGRYRCTLDQGQEEACDSGLKKYQNLGDGPHVFCVYAVDAANNRDPTPDCYSWAVDTTPPDTKIDDASKPLNPTNNTSVAFHFTGSAEAVSFWCKLDSNPLEECSGGTYSKSNLSEGQHGFCVYARDAVGNDDPSPDCYTWTVDVTPPDTVIDETSKPRDPTNSTSVTFRFSGAGEGGRYWCLLDGGIAAACDSGSMTYNSLSERVHIFSVYAVDAAGNADLTPATWRWEVDVTSPETSIDRIVEGDGTPGRNPTNAKSLTFYFSGAGTRGKYSCRLDQAPPEPCDSGSKAYTEEKLPEGIHTFSVYAQDEAGNGDVTPAANVFKIDRTKPIVVVNDPQFNPVTKIWRTNKTSPSFMGTSEPQSTVLLSIDNSSLEELTGADDKGDWVLQTVKTLVDGTHTVKARAIDSALNEGVPSNLVSFIVDTVPPDTKIVKGPARYFNSRSFVLEFEAPSEPPELSKTTTFECKIVAHSLNNKEIVEKCSSPQSYNLAEKFEIEDVNGDYTLSVIAIDEAGNPDPTPASLDWTVAVTPPAVPEISAPQDGEVVYSLSPKISGKTVPKGTVALTIKNGESVRTGIAPADENGEFEFVFPAPLEEGSCQVTAIVTDVALNPSVLSEPRSFTVVTPKGQAHAIGGGLGCAASTAEPWLALLGLTAGAALRSRRRRSRDSLT
jgi:hypothetical protein